MLEWTGRRVKEGSHLPHDIATTSSNWPEWLLYFGQFKSYFALFAAAALATSIVTPIYILLARRMGWVDQPFGRRNHERTTATMGGLVIFAAVFAGALIAIQLDNNVGERLREKSTYIYGLLACTLCMILLGMIDDRHAIRPRVKLMVQGVVAAAAIGWGFRAEAVTLPWFDSVPLHPVVGIAISLLWIVGITNAVNLTDGLDGLAAGICLLAAGVNTIVAIWLGNHYMAVMMALLAGALLGFLRYNFHPARVFLGDTGSLALGMYLALASLHSAQKSHTAVMILVPLFALGYPIFDTLLAVARRMLRGQPLFASDRDHIHHRLIDRGRTPTRAAIQIYIASILVCGVLIAAATANHFVLGLGITGVAVMALFSARVLGYLEWGGWAARWSGRAETKILHAAAELARLKMRRTDDPGELLRSIGIAAAEMGCVRIVLVRGEETIEWGDPERNPGETPTDAGVELALDDQTLIRFTLTGSEALDDERSHLLEDLARELGDRLA